MQGQRPCLSLIHISSYLDLTLADTTGDINCKYWDWNQRMDVPKQGSVIKVQGLVQEYNSRKQLRIERMRAALPQDEVDMACLLYTSFGIPRVRRIRRRIQHWVEG